MQYCLVVRLRLFCLVFVDTRLLVGYASSLSTWPRCLHGRQRGSMCRVSFPPDSSTELQRTRTSIYERDVIRFSSTHQQLFNIDEPHCYFEVMRRVCT